MTDVASITRPSHKLLWQFLVLALMTGPMFPITFLPLYFKYRTLTYRFDDEGVAMSWGWFWRREIHLTYARIQDIHVSLGLVERWLGLGTILVQTASGSASAEMAIVGLTEHAAVRDFLYARMRGAREVDGAAAPPEDDASALLVEIRDELRAIRARLEA